MAEAARRTVLVADDEGDLCDLLAAECARRGYNVLQAFDGWDAWRQLQARSVDAVVLDVRMPRLDGLALLDQLKREDPRAPACVVVSAYSDIAVPLVYETGGEAFLSKPFRLRDLMATLERLLSPASERWRGGPRGSESFRVVVGPREGNGSGEQRVLGIGRGGLCVTSPEPAPWPGERCALDIARDGQNRPAILGQGVIRWSESDACGIEIEHLEEPCRAAYLHWLDELGPRSYIPGPQEPLRAREVLW
jgi:CheY-like chemotaxis protein